MTTDVTVLADMLDADNRYYHEPVKNCPHCLGGIKPRCDTCGGKGWVTQCELDDWQESVRGYKCPRCYGRGIIGVGEICLVCHGWLKVTRAIYDRWMRLTNGGIDWRERDREGWDAE